MRELRKLNYLLAALFVLVMMGCGDDDDDEPSRRALLTAGTWQANRVFVDGNDVSNAIDLNQTNIRFNTDGTYTWVFDGDPIQGEWEFADNEQKIVFDEGTNAEETVNILELSATVLNLEIEEVDPATGVNHKIEIRHRRE